MKIIAYRQSDDIDIQFLDKDGYIYSSIKHIQILNLVALKIHMTDVFLESGILEKVMHNKKHK